jgi:hypothetical protein
LPSRMELERCFFLDDAYRRLVGRRRGDHNRLGFGVQLATVRLLGTFLADPVDVPDDVGDCIAAQLDVAASCLTTLCGAREDGAGASVGDCLRVTVTGTFSMLKLSWFDGSTIWRGRPARVPMRSSLTRLGGCASGRCCCRG